jgi:hypothetical protein
VSWTRDHAGATPRRHRYYNHNRSWGGGVLSHKVLCVGGERSEPQPRAWMRASLAWQDARPCGLRAAARGRRRPATLGRPRFASLARCVLCRRRRRCTTGAGAASRHTVRATCTLARTGGREAWAPAAGMPPSGGRAGSTPGASLGCPGATATGVLGGGRRSCTHRARLAERGLLPAGCRLPRAAARSPPRGRSYRRSRLRRTRGGRSGVRREGPSTSGMDAARALAYGGATA